MSGRVLPLLGVAVLLGLAALLLVPGLLAPPPEPEDDPDALTRTVPAPQIAPPEVPRPVLPVRAREGIEAFGDWDGPEFLGVERWEVIPVAVPLERQDHTVAGRALLPALSKEVPVRFESQADRTAFERERFHFPPAPEIFPLHEVLERLRERGFDWRLRAEGLYLRQVEQMPEEFPPPPGPIDEPPPEEPPPDDGAPPDEPPPER